MKQDIKARINQINNGIVPEGYKKTEYTIIPKNWDYINLGKFAKVIGGGTPSTKLKDYWDGDIDWFIPTEIGLTKYLGHSKTKITEQGLKMSSAKLIPAGNILLTSRATLGEMSFNKYDCCTNQGFQNLIIENQNIKNIVYCSKPFIKKQMMKKANGSTFLEISNTNVKNICINLPKDIKEQERIAEILMEGEKEVDLQQQYIQKLETRKSALMQKLLTPKSDWETMLMKNCLEEQSKRNKSCTITNILSVNNKLGFIPQLEQFSKEVASKNTITYKVVSKGDIAYNPSRINVGSIACYKDEKQGIVSPMYIVFKTNKNINREFFMQFTETHLFNQKMKIVLSGSVRDSLGFRDLCSLKFKLPSLVEQQKIVDILSTADRQIELQKQKLQLLKDRQKSLQQLLLTGIVRV